MMNICSPFRRPCAAFCAAGRLSTGHKIYRSYNRLTENGQYKALRILFCGADDFSITSLRAVRELQEEKPHKIASIEVVCKPDKRVGRGLKQIREVPIKAVARELGLTTHPLDTFTGWDPPSPYDLVIAVSFGLLVPARILDGTTYGGLNVHPSMLPDLRGAAPIQHTILGGRHFAGVSVQTMHPQKIDYGKVIAQTPSPGIKISHELSTEELTNQLAPVGAALLRDSIDQGLFVRPRAIRNEIHMNPRGLEPAPKIKPEDGRINWEKWTANRILRAGRAIGHLWDATMIQRYAAISQEIRVTFDGKWRLVAAKDIEVVKSSDPVRAGDPVRVIPSGTEQAEIAFATMDGQYVAPESITVAGKGKGKGSAHLLRLMKHM